MTSAVNGSATEAIIATEDRIEMYLLLADVRPFAKKAPGMSVEAS